MTTKSDAVPLYLMIIDGARKWLPLRQAGITYNSYWSRVDIGGVVLEDGAKRPITDDERGEIRDIADEYDSNK